MSGDRPRVGVSACLLGQRVRYDAGHKRDPFLTEVLGQHVEWVEVCPEVEAGFGTPREPMRLVLRGAEARRGGGGVPPGNAGPGGPPNRNPVAAQRARSWRRETKV